MIDVFLDAMTEDAMAVSTLGNTLQSHFRFHTSPETAAVAVRLIETPERKLFSASRSRGVQVCTFQSREISQFSEIPRDLYLLVSAQLGLVYWRALMLNPLLRIEDFLVREDRPTCLYSARETIQEYALAFERPYVCKGCVEFFRCLGAESEVHALLQVLHHAARPSRLSSSV